MRDNNRRTYIVPEGSGPNDRISKIIFKCISRNFRGCWPYWSKIPAHDVGFMFTEFEKYFIWDDKDAGKIFYNFKNRTRSRLNGLFHDARKKQKKPRFVPPKMWKEMLHYWEHDDDFKKRSEKGKKARASLKGASLHTAGDISQITVRDRMEKKLGRPITQDELFRATHMKKKGSQQMKILGLSHELNIHMYRALWLALLSWLLEDILWDFRGS